MRNIHPIRKEAVLLPYAADIWQHPNLSWPAAALYLWLARFHGILPRVGEVERATGLGRDRRRALYAELRDAGLLDTRSGTWSCAASACGQ
jgi:hypothetical protein